MDSILAIGLTKSNRILVVTKADSHADQYVYDLAVDSLKEDSKKLFLTAAPTPVSVKWPTLHRSQSYTDLVVSRQIYNGFFATDDTGEYLFINRDLKGQYPGVVYNFQKDEVYQGLIFNGKQQQSMISAPKLKGYYALMNNVSGLWMVQYEFQKETVKESIDPKLSHTAVAPADNHKWRILCQGPAFGPTNGTNGTTMSVSLKNACDTPLKIDDVQDGFVSKDHNFYLFSGKKVYIFAEAVYKENKGVDVVVMDYTEFIQCEARAYSKKTDGKLANL